MEKPEKQSPPAGKLPTGDVTETFRSARQALGQISADLERLRRHAAALVKRPQRAAK